MDSSYSYQFYEYSFLQVYQENIEIKLQQIDLFLKTTPEKLNIENTIDLLDISKEEIQQLMIKYNIDSINPSSFFIIMVLGSSYICGLLRRQLQRGHKEVYSKEDIAYIYQINPEKIDIALDKSQINEITSENLKQLFKYIPVCIVE
ncbi:MAG TPA: hypothetical protein PKK61_07615 [Defluviitaleaceae bacterium]|jgi:hypothetical protein|nr:hypothetical protein [Candidatus Epulonipiscium sp.]HOA80914.1 hypothetical protein [Defluviitaleaceae bacterium]